MTKILGVSGRQQSGKTTCSNFIFGLEMSSLNLIDYFYINDLGELRVPGMFDGEVKEGKFDPMTHNPQVVQYLSEYVWPFVKIYNMADPLKTLCIGILGLSYEQCYGTQDDKVSLTDYNWEDMPGYKKTKHGKGKMTAREVLQYVGTDIFRTMKSSVWVDTTINLIKLEGPELAVIPDIRFLNEIKAVQAEGGKVIRFTRNPYPEEVHESETQLDNCTLFDSIIDNANMSIVEQNETVRQLLESWGYLQYTVEHSDEKYKAVAI